MNKTLYRLAYRNIIKYKKHYIFVSLIILFISIFYSTYTIVQTSYFQVNRLWNEHNMVHGTSMDKLLNQRNLIKLLIIMKKTMAFNIHIFIYRELMKMDTM